MIQFASDDTGLANGGSGGRTRSRGAEQRVSPNAFSPAQVAFINRKMAERGFRNKSELARALDACPASVSKWLSGRRGAGRGMQERLAQALGVTVGELADAGGRRPPLPFPGQTGAPPGVPVVGAVPNIHVLGARSAGTSPLLIGLPIFRSGTAGRVPIDHQAPPPSRRSVLEPDGFGVELTAEAMGGSPLTDAEAEAGAGGPDLRAGDVCWVAPSYVGVVTPGMLVAARVRRQHPPSGGPPDERLVIGLLGGTVDHPVILRYREGQQPTRLDDVDEVEVVGPVVRTIRDF